MVCAVLFVLIFLAICIWKGITNVAKTVLCIGIVMERRVILMRIKEVLFFIFGAMGIGLVFYLPIWLSSTFNKPIDKTVYILGVGVGMIIHNLIDVLVSCLRGDDSDG